MSRVEARKPWASTEAPLPKYTPLVLTRKIWPLPVRLPRMELLPPPMTLLSTTDELEGCRNWTYCPVPMLNCCQSMMAEAVLCLITMLLALGALMVAFPEPPCPPVGLDTANTGAKAPRPSPIWEPRLNKTRRAEFTVAC